MTRGVSLRRGLIALWCLVAAGCAEVTTEPTEDAITIPGSAAAVTTPPAADDAATLEPASSIPIAALADSTENMIGERPAATGSEPVPPPVSTGNVAPREPELAVVAPAALATQELEPAPDHIRSSVASPTSPVTLDFSSLVTRLRKTKAIGLRTKVAVKNQSDDLLEQFRAYHTQRGIATLADLRRSYDLLFHKLHSLLRDADPPLARDIDRSRAAIWELLADPRKFNESQLMAGA